MWKEDCEFIIGHVDFEVPLMELSSMYLDTCDSEPEL